MRLKNTGKAGKEGKDCDTIDSIDMTREDKKNQWAKEILNNIDIPLPVMTSMSKDAQSCHFSFVGLARHASLAEAFIYKTKRFKTTSEVYRAAMYLGMGLLHHIFKNEGTSRQRARADQIYKLIETMEPINYNRQIVDAVVYEIKNIVETAREGIIDFDDMDKRIEELICALPVELRDIARGKIKRVAAGDKISNILNTKLCRGGQKRKGEF